MSKTVKRFEELACWKEARKLVKMVYNCTLSKEFSRDFSLKDQIQRASISVMANIAEGIENYTDQEFIRFLGFSLRSCSEVRSHLYAALDVGYISQDSFMHILKQTEYCSNLIKAFLRYLRRSSP